MSAIIRGSCFKCHRTSVLTSDHPNALCERCAALVATSKHTDGEWEYNPEHTCVEVGTDVICDLDAIGGDCISTPEMHANGQLIAAAPDLLEALKGLLAVNSCRENGKVLYVTHSDPEAGNIAIKAARAAIARAESSP